MPETKTKTDPLVHERFCLPREGASEPRVEGYVHYGDDPGSGRSRPTHNVRRCIECGATHYEPRS